MANPNPSVWGTSETWEYSKMARGLETEQAQELNCDKAHIQYFGAGSTTGYEGSLLRAVNVAEVVEANKPLDRTICPCGQDPQVSPWGKIALFNVNNDGSDTPLVVEKNTPINWFFCDTYYNTADNMNNFYIEKEYTYSVKGGMKNQQWSPNAATPLNTNNTNARISPYVYYGLKSVVLSIQVQLTSSDDLTPSGTWISLDSWKNTYSARNICGLRLYGRFVTNIDTGTNIFIYENDQGQADNYRPFNVGIFETLNVINNEVQTDTDFYTLNIPVSNFRSAVIFEETDNIYNVENHHCYGYLPCWNYFENQTLKTRTVLAKRYFYSIPYSAANYEKCMQIAAMFGCYFTPSSKYQFDFDMLDSDLCLAIIDEDGITHGEYTRGSGNAENNLYDKTSIRDIDYDPTKPVDPNTYSNTTNFNTVSTNAALTKYYVLDKTNVEKLGDDLWTICDGLSAGDFEHFDGKIKDEFLTTNPIDSIVSLARFPFNIPHTFSNTKTAVQLGKSTGTAQGYRTYNVTFAVNFAGIDIFPRFENSFLDYSPYTKYELYIPFCGTIEINPGDILGHKLNLSLYVDLLTGSCIAYIFADSLVIGTAKGSCGLDIQMSGAQTATMNANIYNGILNSQLAETQHITSIGKISLNPFKWYENIEVAETRELQANYDITHNIVPLHKMGSASPLLSWIQEFNARLMIYYPEGDVIDSATPPSLKPAAVASFGHVKGFATATPGIVNDFRVSGRAAFVSGDIVADSIPCTQSERARIKSFFTTGVYLPPKP